MSTLFNVHTVTSYVAGKTKPLEGQRLSKITYKTDSKTGIKPDSKSVSIPAIVWSDIESQVPVIKDHILDLVLKAQDGIVRKLVEAGKDSITSESINIPAIIAAMLEESSGGRLTGETIREWFQESIKCNLLIAFASKLGISDDTAPTAEQSEKLAKILKGYEDSFAKLASGAASFNDTQKSNLIKAIQLSGAEDDVLASKFITRLSKVSDDDTLMNL